MSDGPVKTGRFVRIRDLADEIDPDAPTLVPCPLCRARDGGMVPSNVRAAWLHEHPELTPEPPEVA